MRAKDIVVFIGMPGSGKTTVSRLAAKALGRQWFDCDDEIEAAAGKSVPDIFAEHGEGFFRGLETQCLQNLLRKSGAVIAAGGGAVLHNEELLRESAVVVYLRRDLESIAACLPAGARPLVKGRDSLRILYEQRRGIYERASDLAVDNDGSVEDTVQRVLEALA